MSANRRMRRADSAKQEKHLTERVRALEAELQAERDLVVELRASHQRAIDQLGSATMRGQRELSARIAELEQQLNAATRSDAVASAEAERSPR